MACAFGTHLLIAYTQSVAAARLPNSDLRKHANADVALMALLTHQGECRACRQESLSLRPQPALRSPQHAPHL